MRSSSGVASFNQENEASDVEESGFGKTKEEILWPCHEEAIRHCFGTMLAKVNAGWGRLPGTRVVNGSRGCVCGYLVCL
jgi:hypothetical protein